VRAVAAVAIGLALIFVWCASIVHDQDGWLSWLQLVAGVVAVVTGFALVRTSGTARAWLALDGLVLLVSALMALRSATPAWVSWSGLIAALAAGVVSAPSRSPAARRRRGGAP
jgi:hypothetical protein